MTGPRDWQTRVGDVWAAEWRRTDRSLADLSTRLDAAILAAAPGKDGNVLDIGCGAGATCLALATARPDLSITGVDLSAALLSVARQRLPSGNFMQADAAAALPDIRPNLLVSRHGVMFFSDPVAAFTGLHRQAAPGARLIFSCFGAPERNAFASDLPAALFGTVSVPVHGYAPGPFGFADPDVVGAMLASAGWSEAAPEPVAFDYVGGAGDDPVADAAAFLSRIGPVARRIADAPEADRAAIGARLSRLLARYRVDDRIVLPAFAWIWRARRG